MSDVSEEAPNTNAMINATLQDSWKRLWVDLPPGVDVASLAERLGRGMVSNLLTIEVARQGSFQSHGFGYLQIGDEDVGRKIHRTYNKSLFQGHRIKLCPSKPGYLERLEHERAVEAAREEAATEKRRLAAMAFEKKERVPSTIFRLRPKPGAELVVVDVSEKRQSKTTRFSAISPVSLEDLSWEIESSLDATREKSTRASNQKLEQKIVSNEASEAVPEKRKHDREVEEEEARESKETDVRDARDYEKNDGSSDEESDEESDEDGLREEEDDEADEDEKWVLEMNKASESVEASRRVENSEREARKEAAAKTSKSSSEEFAGFSDDDDDDDPSNGDVTKRAPSGAQFEAANSALDHRHDSLPIKEEEAAVPSLSDGQLHDNLASEANQSLSILSSLLGGFEPSTTPSVANGSAHRNGEAGDATEVSSAPAPKKAPSKFAVTERFRGQEDLSRPAVVDETKPRQEEEPSLSTSADLTSLKSIFHGVWASKPPEFGFAPHEDPATLSGFKAMAERVTATQGHSFAFSFQPNDESTATTPFLDAVNNNEVPAAPQGPVAPPAVVSLPLWGGYSRMAKEARSFLEVRAAVADWKEQRRFVMQDAKRKYRTFVHGAAALKSGQQKASKVSQ